MDGLGINETNRKLITENVSVIFHVAATVKFDETLRRATAVNVKGTKEVLNIAKECRNLESFVYVSTAYSNCPHKYIEERFYETPINCEKLFNLLDLLNDEQLEELTPK